jgi:hypothetical protein
MLCAYVPIMYNSLLCQLLNYLHINNTGKSKTLNLLFGRKVFTDKKNLHFFRSIFIQCSKPPSYVLYKGTYVLYDGTYGASDQGQMLDV